MISQLCVPTLKEYQTVIDHHSTIVLIFCILNFTSCLVTVFGNVLVIIALRKAMSNPLTLKKLFLNLAFSDLAVGLVPQSTNGVITAVMLKMQANGHYDFNIICPSIYSIYRFCLMLLASASFLTITAIATDRFLAIYLHFRYHELVTSGRVAVVLASLWLTSSMSAFLFISVPQQHPIVTFVLGFLGLLATTVTHIYIFKVARYHQNQMQSQRQVHSQNSTRFLREKKSLLNAFLVFAVFVDCYVPSIFTKLLRNIKFSLPFIVANYVAAFFVFFNSSLNPEIYCWRYGEIRRNIKGTLKKVFGINL